MTNEDELAIAHYMNWHYAEHEGIYYYDWDGRRQRNLDLNDASLVVAEMQKRGEWLEYRDFTIDFLIKELINHRFPSTDLTFWLMSMEGGVAKNFFSAFVEWRKK